MEKKKYYDDCDCDPNRPMTPGEAELAAGLDELFKDDPEFNPPVSETDNEQSMKYCNCHCQEHWDKTPREFSVKDVNDNIPHADLVRIWAKQGRTSEQIYGVINFLTGEGSNIGKDLTPKKQLCAR